MANSRPLRCLLTGATGFLGSRVVWALWQEGWDLELLHRGRSPQAMRAHLAALAGLFGGSTLGERPLPSWVHGDVLVSRAGVSPNWIERNRGRFDVVIHMAADTRLRPVRPEDQTKTNIAGTGNVADLAVALECSRFHHVSTASVAGNTTGEFSESDLEMGQTFRTHSEWTKFEAERMLRTRAGKGAFCLTVHRPAILVGDSVTGGAATFPHFYQLLAAWRRYADQRHDNDEIILPLSPGAAMPLIPVDHVAVGITAAVKDAEADGKTFHWTPRSELTLGELNEILARILKTKPIVFDLSASWPLTGQTGAAKTLWDWVRLHRAHLSGGVHCRRDNADALCKKHGLTVPEVNEVFLEHLHRHWAWATRRR